MSNYYVITFESVHYVIKAEKLLKQYGVDVVLIATPRDISFDCGIALKVFEENQEMIRDLFQKKKLVPDGFYLIKEKNKEGLRNRICKE